MSTPDLILPSPEQVIAQQAHAEKEATVTLPPDEAEWVPMIIDELNMQFPEVGHHSVEVVFNAKNSQEGVATGDIHVADKLTIPYVIDNFKLQPFDMFLHEDELYPMQRRTLSRVLNQGDFGQLVEPGRGETSDSFLTNALPPFDGKYTFAGRGVYNGEMVIDTLGEMSDELVLAALEKGQHIRKLATAVPSEPPRHKVANDRFVKKSAQVFGTDEDCGLSALKNPKPGVYDIPIVGMEKGAATLACYLFTKQLDDITGEIVSQPLLCGVNGEGYSKLAEFVYLGACRGEKEMLEKVAEPKAGGTYVFLMHDGEQFIASQPYTIKAASANLMITVAGMRISANSDLKAPVKTAEELTLPGSKLMALPVKRAALIPYSLTQAAKIATSKALTLQYNVLDRSYTLRGVKEAGYDVPMHRNRMFNTLKRYYDDESLNAALSKAARLGSVFIANNIQPTEWEVWQQADLHDAAQHERLQNHLKVAKYTWPDATARKQCVAAALLIDAFEQELDTYNPLLQSSFCKVAADSESIGGHDSVDSLLSLNHLNEETLYRYIDSIDTLKNARQVCLRMLLASRIGLPVPAAPLRAAAFALDEVVGNLDRLRQVISASR